MTSINKYTHACWTVGKKVHKILNGVVIETYISISDASRKNNIALSTMKLAVKEKRTCNGFSWIASSETA